MKPTTKDWINFAKDDLDSAQTLNSQEHLTNIVSFHVHQTIEKCFKAIMEEKDINLQRTHNLVTLYSSIRDFLQIDCNTEIIEELNELYISSRYPSDIGLLPLGKPTKKDADNFLHQALEIYKKVLNFLEKEK